MTSTFTGFSEDDLKRIKGSNTVANSGAELSPVKKISKIGLKPQRKLPVENSATVIPVSDDEVKFDKCRLSLKSSDEISINNKEEDCTAKSNLENGVQDLAPDEEIQVSQEETNNIESRKYSDVVAPDIVRCVDNYTENDTELKAKLAELQLKQRLMEEQNKIRKEMLSKALADRTKQTEEEVQKLEKIKKELNILDGQLSQDVAVLRKKIDQACLTYADAEKNYLKVEKEFLQAKINLQKEKDKKELLTEHLCTLITHNETRKAQKLETLMVQLAIDKNLAVSNDIRSPSPLEENPVIIDGVDQKTGKMVEFTN